jgi:hypothetical protein
MMDDRWSPLFPVGLFEEGVRVLTMEMRFTLLEVQSSLAAESVGL